MALGLRVSEIGLGQRLKGSGHSEIDQLSKSLAPAIRKVFFFFRGTRPSLPGLAYL